MPCMTCKIRKTVCDDLYTPSKVGPGPLIVTFLSITSSPVVRPMFRRFSKGSNWMTSPLVASASAWRNVPGPLSFVLVTLVVGVTVGVGVAQDGNTYVVETFCGGGMLQKSWVKNPVEPCTPPVKRFSANGYGWVTP